MLSLRIKILTLLIITETKNHELRKICRIYFLLLRNLNILNLNNKDIVIISYRKKTTFFKEIKFNLIILVQYRCTRRL